MDLGNLKSADGAKKSAKRVGRGPGSGNGKTSGRGHNGQKARTGAKTRSWFEGGQMPLQRRIPKRGFTNIFRKTYSVVDVNRIEQLGKKDITPDILIASGLVRSKQALVKVLGNGEVTKPMEIKAHAFSKSAVAKIEAAGGKAILL
ncbi:50S ribosomal protein L15 [bacterium]|nr:50S ribosomal protein L15 [bacterium]